MLDVINGKMDLDEYTEAYIELLEDRIPNPQETLDKIPDGSFLLCYEKATDTCHRHIMRDWFLEKTGFVIEEWKNEKEQREADQLGIVDDLLEL